MSPHDSLPIVPPTASSTGSFTSQPIDLDNAGLSVSPPPIHPTPKEAPYLSEDASGDISDLDYSESEDDLSPILNALIVSSIKNRACFYHQSDICNIFFFTRQSQFLKTLLMP